MTWLKRIWAHMNKRTEDCGVESYSSTPEARIEKRLEDIEEAIEYITFRFFGVSGGLKKKD